MIGHPDSEVIAGTLRSLKEHQLKHQRLSAEELKQRVCYNCIFVASSS